MVQDASNETQSLSKYMKVFLLVAAIVIAAIVLVLTLEKQPAIDQASLESEVATIQQTLPIRIDAHTELTNVDVGQMRLTYSLTALNHLANEDNQAFAKQAEAAVKTNACRNKNIKNYIDNNVTLFYRYLSKDQITIAEFEIPAGFCNGE